MKRFAATILVLVIVLSNAVCASALGTESVTVQKGDTIIGICNRKGLSYNACKSTIMKLNNMSSENELNNIKIGRELILPSENPVIETGVDEVEYYIIGYVMEKGNWLANVYYCWGLNYEDYIDDIKAINGISDLDTVYVDAFLLLPTTAENVMSDNYIKVMRHIMQAGETAYSVISGYGLNYNDMEAMLIKYNKGKDLAKLRVGEKLLIPFYE